MNNFKKKLLGAACLLAVITMTIFAGILPTYGANAATDILVNIEVENQDFSLAITSPDDDGYVVSPSLVATLAYHSASNLFLVVSGPGGEQSTHFSGGAGGVSGTVNVPFALEQGYGVYTVTPKGTDMSTNPQSATPITINYHSASGIVINPGTEDGTSTTDPVTKVEYGPEVCKVGFQLYTVDPMGSPQYDITKPLLAPPYMVDLTPGDSPIDITIPISKAPYNLKGGLYKIIMTSYDCTTGDPIEEDLDADGGYDGRYYFSNPEGEITPPVVPEPPDTGVVRIGGMMIAESDLVITGIIALATVVAAYLFLRLRKKSVKRSTRH